MLATRAIILLARKFRGCGRDCGTVGLYEREPVALEPLDLYETLKMNDLDAVPEASWVALRLVGS